MTREQSLGNAEDPVTIPGRKETKMTAYCIDYTVKGKKYYWVHIDAKDIKSAKKKLGKKHGYKDGRMVHIDNVCIVGYY